MLKIFLDTDVLLDVLTQRKPYAKISTQLFDLAKNKEVKLYTTESVLINALYVGEKHYDIKNMTLLIDALLDIVNLLNGNKKILSLALNSEFKDKEDAIQYYIALSNDMDYFVSRNIKDYQPFETGLKVFHPQKFIEFLN